MTVLVADDDEDQLFVRSMLLRQHGFEPVAAKDVESALEQAAAHQPRCAVIDLRLPTEESGRRLIRELKALDSKIQVIVLTGADAKRFARCAEKELVEEILVKGSPSTRLIERLTAIAKQTATFGRGPRPA